MRTGRPGKQMGIVMATARLVLAAWLIALAAILAPPGRAEEPDRIIAIGDLHGDLAAYLDIVGEAGLADADGKWTGGDTTLVQLGDVVDRGPDSRAIQEHLRALQQAAPRAGGEVVLLLGNHEAMNVLGDLRYVSAGEYAAFVDGRSERRRDKAYKANQAQIEAFYAAAEPPLDAREARLAWLAATPLGKVEHDDAWTPRDTIGAWVTKLPAIVRIGDTIFVHGGLSAEMAGRSIADLNAAVQAALRTPPSEGVSIAEDELGPLWYRGNSTRGEADAARPSIEEELTTVLAAYGARRLVVAHTPSIAGIGASQDGRLLRIDTGISSYYGGPHSFLELTGGRALAHERTGDGAWTVRELPTPDPAP